MPRGGRDVWNPSGLWHSTVPVAPRHNLQQQCHPSPSGQALYRWGWQHPQQVRPGHTSHPQAISHTLQQLFHDFMCSQRLLNHLWKTSSAACELQNDEKHTLGGKKSPTNLESLPGSKRGWCLRPDTWHLNEEPLLS